MINLLCSAHTHLLLHIIITVVCCIRVEINSESTTIFVFNYTVFLSPHICAHKDIKLKVKINSLFVILITSQFNTCFKCVCVCHRRHPWLFQANIPGDYCTDGHPDAVLKDVITNWLHLRQANPALKMNRSRNMRKTKIIYTRVTWCLQQHFILTADSSQEILKNLIKTSNIPSHHVQALLCWTIPAKSRYNVRTANRNMIVIFPRQSHWGLDG